MLQYRLLTSIDTSIMQAIVWEFRQQKISDEKAASFLNNNTHLVYACLDDDKIAGYILAYRLERMDLGNDMLLIYHVFVKDEYQHRHIAKTLMNMATSYATEHALHYTFLITQDDNVASNALYKSCGGYLHPHNKMLYYWYGPDSNSN